MRRQTLRNAALLGMGVLALGGLWLFGYSSQFSMLVHGRAIAEEIAVEARQLGYRCDRDSQDRPVPPASVPSDLSDRSRYIESLVASAGAGSSVEVEARMKAIAPAAPWQSGIAAGESLRLRFRCDGDAMRLDCVGGREAIRVFRGAFLVPCSEGP